MPNINFLQNSTLKSILSYINLLFQKSAEESIINLIL